MPSYYDRKAADPEDLLATTEPARVLWEGLFPSLPYAPMREDRPKLDRRLAIMALTPHLLHLVLAEDCERMAGYLGGADRRALIATAGLRLCKRDVPSFAKSPAWPNWPLPNVVPLARVTDQESADREIPHLLACPARWRGVLWEVEGAVDWRGCVAWPRLEHEHREIVNGIEIDPRNLGGLISALEGRPTKHATGLVGEQVVMHYLIAQATDQPAHPDWLRATRDACEQAGVAFWLEGEFWHGVEVLTAGGEFKVGEPVRFRRLDGRTHREQPWRWEDGAWR